MSLIEGNDDSNENGGGAATVVPADSAAPEATPTETPLPDRTTCTEIQGTQYRSPSEREFYLGNCLATPTPEPDEPDSETDEEPPPEEQPADSESTDDTGG